MSNFNWYKLSDIYFMSSGLSSKKEQAGHGAPFLSFRTIFNNYFIPNEINEFMNVSEKELNTYSILKGDVFLTRTSETSDELAMSSVALKDYPQTTFSGFAKRLRPRETGIVYEKYIGFYLRSPYFRKVIKNNTIMTLRASFNEDIFNFINIYLPEYNTQTKIGDLLFSIERKIEQNKKINDNLLAMAQDIYMHCFFKKSSNGKLNDILLEANKSKVQVGYAKNCSGQYPFFTSGASILTLNEYFVDGRYCFLNTGGNADVKFYVGKSAYSTDTWCICTNNDMDDYLYLLLSTLKEEINKKYFQGTGLKHLQKDLLKNKDIYIPTEAELYKFNNIVKPLFDNISKNISEIEKLVNLRDFLLPLLMNGQATIE